MKGHTILLFMIVIMLAVMPGLRASADGAVSVSAAPEEMKFSFEGCRAGAVYECSTGTLLAGYSEETPLPIGHLAKLMVFYLAAEKIQSGELSEDDLAVCSHLANSQQGSQIWLGIGEKITVCELMKAISIGNANDACVCLAEKLFGSVEAYAEAANCKAKELGMVNTHFSDCTGLDASTVASASDLCRLCCELAKLTDFTPYFTTWLDTVRGGRAELVSRNRLMRSYKGTRGFKVGMTEGSGECAAVCADRADMTVCAVVLGAVDEEALLELSSDLLDSAVSHYEIYYPEVPEEALADIRVAHGVRETCGLDAPALRPVIITKGSYRSIECSYERPESISAPVVVGDRVGVIEFTSEGRCLISAEICVSEEVAEVDYGFAFKRILFNLLNI